MKSRLRAVLALLALMMALPALAEVSASLDRNEVAPGESVQLTLQRDSRGKENPDLAPLRQDFDILSQSRSSNIEIINGSISSSVRLLLTLSPRRSGALTIPALEWGGEKSQPLTLKVSSAAASTGNNKAGAGAPGGQAVFMETAVDTRTPFVQAAVQLKVRLFVATRIYRASLDLPANPDVLVQQVGEDRQSEVERNGARYQVVERNYLLFPQRSGTLTLPGPVLDAQVPRQQPRDDRDPFSGFFAGTLMGNAVEPMRVRGDAVTLDVRPRPAEAGASYWLPARKVELQAQWKPDAQQVRAGEPLTLQLQLAATGLTAAQLPELAPLLALPDGIKAYPDPAALKDTPQGDTVLGTRTQNIVLIADHAGDFTLPELKVQWWDTAQNALRHATVPARHLQVLPALAGQTPAQPPASATGNTNPASTPAPGAGPATPDNTPANASTADATHGGAWRIAAISFGVLWLLTLAALGALFWRRKKHPANTPQPAEKRPAADGSSARKAFLAACQQHDAQAARQHLLAWARAHWADAPPAGLNALARRLDPAPSGQVRALDRACHTGTPWQGDALAAALSALPGEPHAASAKAAKNAPGIAPLYP